VFDSLPLVKMFTSAPEIQTEVYNGTFELLLALIVNVYEKLRLSRLKVSNSLMVAV
jgi:hypothetical protein